MTRYISHGFIESEMRYAYDSSSTQLHNSSLSIDQVTQRTGELRVGAEHWWECQPSISISVAEWVSTFWDRVSEKTENSRFKFGD